MGMREIDARVEVLRTNPEAFGSTFEVENARPLSWFSDRLGGSTVLGAFRNAELVAIAGFAVQQGRKRAHKGERAIDGGEAHRDQKR
jgi:hypothetical protein